MELNKKASAITRSLLILISVLLSVEAVSSLAAERENSFDSYHYPGSYIGIRILSERLRR